LEYTAADEFLLAAVQTLVTFPIVLASKRFAADGADKRTLVGVRAQVRSKVVRSSKTFRTQAALVGGRMLLDALGATSIGAICRRSSRIGEIEYVVTAVG
jgi:hypothetical protein